MAAIKSRSVIKSKVDATSKRSGPVVKDFRPTELSRLDRYNGCGGR